MKRIISFLLIAVMLFSTLPVTHAYVQSTGDSMCANCISAITCAICGKCPNCEGVECDCQAPVDYTTGTQVTYTADSNANRDYTITVPALLSPGQSGTVTLKGMWASNEAVKVTADASVELTNSINAADKHTLEVYFDGIEKAGDNTVEKTYTETVAVEEMSAAALFGTWSGKFNYNVDFVELIGFTIDGVPYVAEEGMTWEVWLWSSYDDAISLGMSGDDMVYEVESGDFVYLGGEKVSILNTITENGAYTVGIDA